MRCSTCDSDIPAGQSLCPRCGTAAGAPAVWPTARTYSVWGLGIAVAIVVALAVLAAIGLRLWPLAGHAMARLALDRNDPELLNVAAGLEAVLAIAFLVPVLATTVLLIIWMWRARKNLDAFPNAEQGMGAGWAIGGWFIPLANLVIPYRVMANIARASLRRARTPALVWVWWLSWIAGGIGSRIFDQTDTQAYLDLPDELSSRADYERYVDYYANAVGPNLALAALLVVAGAALTALVLRISRAQEGRIARREPATPLMPGDRVYYTPPPVPDPSPRSDYGPTRS